MVEPSIAKESALFPHTSMLMILDVHPSSNQQNPRDHQISGLTLRINVIICQPQTGIHIPSSVIYSLVPTFFPNLWRLFPAKCPPPLPWRVRKPPTKSQRRWSRLVKRWRHLLQQKCPWCCGGTCALALTVACTRIWCYCYGLPFNGAHGILQIGS